MSMQAILKMLGRVASAQHAFERSKRTLCSSEDTANKSTDYGVARGGLGHVKYGISSHKRLPQGMGAQSR